MTERTTTSSGDLQPSITSANRKQEPRATASILGIAAQALGQSLDDIDEGMTTVRRAPRVLESPMHAQAIRRTERAATAMRATLDALADIAQLAEGTRGLRLASLDLTDLLMAIVGTWTTEAPAYTLELSMPGEVPAILADEARLERAFNLLIESAIRQNPDQKPIRITIRAAEQHIVVSVRHPVLHTHTSGRPGAARDGEGSTHPSRTRAATGDLAELLVTSIASAHGGRIWTEVEDNAEITTSMSLPLTPPTPEIAGGVPPAQGATMPAPQTVVARAQPVLVLAERDQRMARYLRANLETQGYRVLSALDRDDLYGQLDLSQPDLVLVESALVDDETGALAHLCGYAGVPVVVIGPSTNPLACAQALDQGASDYLAKPLTIEEVLARCRSVLRTSARRDGPANREAELELGDLRIDLGQHAVHVAGEAVRLSKTEFKLLRALAQHAGAVLSHETLLERVWGQGYERDVDFLWVYIRRLRRKIEPDPAKPRYILTVPGVGYRLARG